MDICNISKTNYENKMIGMIALLRLSPEHWQLGQASWM